MNLFLLSASALEAAKSHGDKVSTDADVIEIGPVLPFSAANRNEVDNSTFGSSHPESDSSGNRSCLQLLVSHTLSLYPTPGR